MLFTRFPVEYQMDSQDCGPASLKIIAKHFGKFYSLQYLRDRCGITKEGVSLLDLSIGAESIGLRTLAIKCTVDDVVNSIPFPAIVFWNNNHFVVVYAADKRHVWVSDPAKGRVKYTREQFRKGWCRKDEKQGVLLAVEPAADFKDSEAQKAQRKNSFSGILKYFLPYKNNFALVFSTFTFLLFTIILLVYNAVIFYIFLAGSILYVVWVLLFLDEATNSLDAINERRIVDALNGAFKDRTVIVVAHRLSTIRNADQIVVLDKGFVVEMGNHDTLMEKKGQYYNLVSTQMQA